MRLSARHYRTLVAVVADRDRDCRVCGRWAHDKGHTHHIRYRSLGGEDSLENCILLCPECHEDEHAKRIRITGTADNLTVETRR